MENNIKYEVIHENASNQVEITMEDIVGADYGEPEDDNEYKLSLDSVLPSAVRETIAKSIESDHWVKVKTEPFDDSEWGNSQISSNNNRPETNIRIKTEIENIKQETYLEGLPAKHSENNNNNVWTEGQEFNLAQCGINIKQKTEEFSDSGDSSDYFVEDSNKVEGGTGDYLTKVDSSFFNQHRNFAFIKEDIEFEDHCLKSESDIKKERPNDKNAPLFECNLCEYKTRRKDSLQIHLTLHEDPCKLLWYFCTKCNYKTRQKSHLRRHDLTHQKLGELKLLFTCAICDYKFKEKGTLRRHLNNVHLYDKKNKELVLNGGENDQRHQDQILKCSECSYSTFKKGLLLSHLDKHKDTRDVNNLYICDICSFSTKYRRNLRVHFEIHKESQELQIFECKPCRFKTRMGYCLKRHFLSKKHLLIVGKLEEYCPRSMKLKQETDS